MAGYASLTALRRAPITDQSQFQITTLAAGHEAIACEQPKETNLQRNIRDRLLQVVGTAPIRQSFCRIIVMTPMENRGYNAGNRIWEVAMKELVHCRAMESLYRQGAALHPEDSWKLLAEAEKWRHRALDQIAARFEECNTSAQEHLPLVA